MPPRSPEEVLSGILRRLASSPAAASIVLLDPPPAVPPPPGFAAILAAPLVRCADCDAVRYVSTPPPPARRGELWRERLECRHGLDVTPRELVTPSRYCTLFNRRPSSRQGGNHE
jgi:hypothetical protein